MNNFIHIWSTDNWKGPKDKIWDDEQCPYLGHGERSNLDSCKESCTKKDGCTAINYRDGSDCVLRGCEIPVPEPTWIHSNYKGYYIGEGNFTKLE